jgi:hypothetical protein
VRENLGGSPLFPWWLPLVLVGSVLGSGLGLVLFVRRATTYDLEQWHFEPGQDEGPAGFDM